MSTATQKQDPTRHMGLVGMAVATYVGRYQPADLDDLAQDGAIGLMYACKQHDPEKGVPFGAYAAMVVKMKIQNERNRSVGPITVCREAVRQEYAYRRKGTPDAEIPTKFRRRIRDIRDILGRTVLDATPGLPHPLSSVAAPDNREVAMLDDHEELTVVMARAGLAPDEHTAVLLRHGLDGGGERSEREVGLAIGVSRTTAGKVIARALVKLKVAARRGA